DFRLTAGSFSAPFFAGKIGPKLQHRTTLNSIDEDNPTWDLLFAASIFSPAGLRPVRVHHGPCAPATFCFPTVHPLPPGTGPQPYAAAPECSNSHPAYN